MPAPEFLSAPEELVLIWDEAAGVYVDEGGLALFGAGVPTAHWSTVEEAASIASEEGVRLVGGPVATAGVVR